MFRATIISLFLLQANFVRALPASCDQFVKSYTEYNQKENGQMVNKFTISDLDHWARNSRFQGLLLTPKAPQDVEVILEAKKSMKAKSNIVNSKSTSVFRGDKKYRVVNIDVEKYLGEAPESEGYYIVRVVAEGKELCSVKKRIYNDGE